MVHAALLLLMLEAVHTDLVYHQPEAQHPKSSAIHKLAGRLPHLYPQEPPFCCSTISVAEGHVWTAPSWQGFFHECSIGSVQPCVAGSELARLFSRVQHWSVQPCVRPKSAVRMTAGHSAFRGSGPGRRNAEPVDPAIRQPTRARAPDTRRDLVQAASATGSL